MLETSEQVTSGAWRSQLSRRGGQKQKLCYGIGAFGFALRWLLWYLSEGTNDIRTWLRFAQEIHNYGLGATYRLDTLFNHPPLMGLLARATWLATWRVGMPFAQAFKLYGMLADLCSMLLLLHIWRRRAQPERAALAFAGYGLALCAILVCGYHGNTDPVYWCLVLCSVYLLQDRASPLCAGLVLGAALEIKLIPIVVVLPLAACCRSRAAVVRYLLGVALALVPFAVIVGQLSEPDRAGFVRNVLGYTSYREFWGLELLVRALMGATQASVPLISQSAELLGVRWAEYGSKILLALTSLLALTHALRRYSGLDAYTMAALCFCLFLVFASGFGVQYMGAVVPLLFACRIRDASVFATVSGLFIALIYLSFVLRWDPVFGQHTYFSAVFAVPSFITWWLVLRIALRLWRTRNWPAPYHG